jgi:hypothetical protein
MGGCWWKELTLEASIKDVTFHNFARNKENQYIGGYSVGGVWADRTLLPFSVEVC